MMEILGFIVLCGLNAFFSIGCLIVIFYGGEEFSSIFTSNDRAEKIFMLCLLSLNIYWWLELAESAPFKIIAS